MGYDWSSLEGLNYAIRSLSLFPVALSWACGLSEVCIFYRRHPYLCEILYSTGSDRGIGGGRTVQKEGGGQ